MAQHSAAATLTLDPSRPAPPCPALPSTQVVGVDPGPEGSAVLMLEGGSSALGHASVAQVRAWQAAAGLGGVGPAPAGAPDVAEAARTLAALSHSATTHSGGRLRWARRGEVVEAAVVGGGGWRAAGRSLPPGRC
jgi:hypothetical protein